MIESRSYDAEGGSHVVSRVPRYDSKQRESNENRAQKTQ